MTYIPILMPPETERHASRHSCHVISASFFLPVSSFFFPLSSFFCPPHPRVSQSIKDAQAHVHTPTSFFNSPPPSHTHARTCKLTRRERARERARDREREREREKERESERERERERERKRERERERERETGQLSTTKANFHGAATIIRRIEARTVTDDSLGQVGINLGVAFPLSNFVVALIVRLCRVHVCGDGRAWCVCDRVGMHVVHV